MEKKYDRLLGLGILMVVSLSLAASVRADYVGSIDPNGDNAEKIACLF